MIPYRRVKGGILWEWFGQSRQLPPPSVGIAPLKMTLTIREAAEYSNIGINKMDRMLRMPNCPIVPFAGSKKLVKRKAFEDYIGQRLII